MWLLAYFPLWAVMAGVWFGLASVPKRGATASMCSFLDGSAMLLSICTAAGILVGLNCQSVISIPFADQACHGTSFELSALRFPMELIPFR